MAEFLRRRVQAAGVGSSSAQAEAGTWAKPYPALCEFLTVTSWAPGEPRATGSLSIFLDAGVWKCCLSDKDAGQVAFLSAGEPGALLASLEKALRADTLDWRPAFRGKGKGGK